MDQLKACVARGRNSRAKFTPLGQKLGREDRVKDASAGGEDEDSGPKTLAKDECATLAVTSGEESWPITAS